MTAHPDPEFVVPAAQQLAWIEEICAQGIRRPGTDADAWAEGWAVERFLELGLHDVRPERVELPFWDFRSASVTAWDADDPSSVVVMDAFALPHTAATPADGFEADLAPFADDAPDVAGRIALDHLHLMHVPQPFITALATSIHDPDGDFSDLVQTMPFGDRMTQVLEPVMAAGAAGFVGVLAGVPWDTNGYYVPYDAVERPVPAVWVSARDGAELDRLVADHPGSVRCRIMVDAVRAPGRSYNIVGHLPGPGDEWVVVASHHDGPWASAVEDASGMALVVAQAAYWSRVPREERPHNLLFALTAGHMAHAAGTQALVESLRDLLDSIVLEVHLEHAANEVVGDGTMLTPTGHPEVRWFFTSRDPALERTVQAALEAEDLRRSMVLHPEVFGVTPPTDAAFFHPEGVPLVSFLTAPMYLFDPADTLDKVHVASLEPLTRATARIVASMAGRTAAEVRAAVRAATAGG